jgi:hypothetical protein
MDVSKTNAASTKDRVFPKGKFGHSTRNRIARSAAADECMINIKSPQHNIKLYGQAEAEGPKGRGSNSNPFTTIPGNIDVSKTSWPELRTPVLYQQHGNKSKLANVFISSEHILKEGLKRGSEVKEREDIASSVFVEHTDMSFTPLQTTSYSSKTKGYSSAEERLFNDSSTAVELQKSSNKNIYQFHNTSSRKPRTCAGIHNHTSESESYTSCGNVGGVTCEKEKICGIPSAAAGPSKTFCDVLGDKLDLAFKLVKKGENFPQPQLKEENIIIGSMKVSSNQRKRTCKEEKKRVQEEEARKRMLVPKDHRVRLVSRKMLEALLNSDTENMSLSTHQRAAPAMNEEEFPTMEESRMQRMKLKDEHPCGAEGDDSQRRDPSCGVQLKLKNLGSDSDWVNSSSAEGQVIVPTNSMSVRNRKRKDPIEIDLVNLIKVGILLVWPYYYNVYHTLVYAGSFLSMVWILFHI